MDFLQALQDYSTALVPTFVAVILVALVLTVTSRLLERRRIRTGEPRIMSQAVMVVLGFLGLVALILAYIIRIRGQKRQHDATDVTVELNPTDDGGEVRQEKTTRGYAETIRP